MANFYIFNTHKLKSSTVCSIAAWDLQVKLAAPGLRLKCPIKVSKPSWGKHCRHLRLWSFMSQIMKLSQTACCWLWMPAAVLSKEDFIARGCFLLQFLQLLNLFSVAGLWKSFLIGPTLPFVNATTGAQDSHSNKVQDLVIQTLEFIFPHVTNHQWC